MKLRILLTGATGFIGSHLLEELIESGYEVTILIRNNSKLWRIEKLRGKFSFFNLDNISIKQIFSIEKFDYIIHLATFYKKTSCVEDVSEMIESNIKFPVLLLEEGIRNNLKGFINTGTFFECDTTTSPIKIDADLKPYNHYAKTKIGFESILKTYKDNLKIISLRLFSPYGEKDNEKVIPLMIEKYIKGQELNLNEWDSGLDFVYVKDIAKAYVKSLNYMMVRDNFYDIFNIGSGQSYSPREVFYKLRDISGKKIKANFSKKDNKNSKKIYADIKKTSDLLDWMPCVSLEIGLSNTYNYYLGILHDNK